MVDATWEDDQDVRMSRHFSYDRCLLTALVDRWRLKKHTLYLPCEEMALRGLLVVAVRVGTFLGSHGDSVDKHMIRYASQLVGREVEAIQPYAWGPSGAVCDIPRPMRRIPPGSG